VSVTFSAQTPMTAKAHFGQQKQLAKANVSQFSGGVNPANGPDGPKANVAGPKFGAICTTMCCIGAAPIAIVGGLLTGLFFIGKAIFKGIFRGG